MSKRINVMIDADTWGFLGRIPAGERSRAINEALRAWATKRRRGDAAREMDALRAQMPKSAPKNWHAGSATTGLEVTSALAPGRTRCVRAAQMGTSIG